MRPISPGARRVPGDKTGGGGLVDRENALLLDSRAQEVLYKIFEWPHLPKSKLVLIGQYIFCVILKYSMVLLFKNLSLFSGRHPKDWVLH